MKTDNFSLETSFYLEDYERVRHKQTLKAQMLLIS